MIIKGGDKSLVGRYKIKNISEWMVVTEVYKGVRLVWEAINSCFGSGAWINDKPWSNTDGWNNG